MVYVGCFDGLVVLNRCFPDSLLVEPDQHDIDEHGNGCDEQAIFSGSLLVFSSSCKLLL